MARTADCGIWRLGGADARDLLPRRHYTANGTLVNVKALSRKDLRE